MLIFKQRLNELASNRSVPTEKHRGERFTVIDARMEVTTSFELCDCAARCAAAIIRRVMGMV